MYARRKPGSVRAAAAWAVAAMALGAWSAAAWADGARPQSDDKCVAHCDEQSDKCMLDAGKDAQKQRACDSAYDECLRKCG
jgi:hypothetical protein